MSKTLNLTDSEARTIHHLAENELTSMTEGAVPEDDEYRAELKSIIEKLE